MRKPRDYDSELKALDDRARQLKIRKVQQLGELVVATGADTLSIDMLAGLLVGADSITDPSIREGWRAKGEAFFQASRRGASGSAQGRRGDKTNAGAASAAGSTPSA